MAALARIIMCVRDVQAAVSFYSRLGVRVLSHTHDSAVLDARSTLITLETATSEAQLSRGYSPFLEFRVPDLDTLVPTLLMAGAHMDGRIVYESTHKLVVLRAPCGHMLSLVEMQEPAPAKAAPGAPPQPPQPQDLR